MREGLEKQVQAIARFGGDSRGLSLLYAPFLAEAVAEVLVQGADHADFYIYPEDTDGKVD